MGWNEIGFCGEQPNQPVSLIVEGRAPPVVSCDGQPPPNEASNNYKASAKSSTLPGSVTKVLRKFQDKNDRDATSCVATNRKSASPSLRELVLLGTCLALYQ